MNYKKRILFVDDEPNFLDDLRRMLRSQKIVWDMSFVNSVDEALDEINLSLFNTVVTDVNMPGKDGFELLNTLRSTERTKDIPVIVLTVNSENEIKRRALDQGATDLLDKPVSHADLLARIRSVLRIQEYQEELKAKNVMLERRIEERTLELEKARFDIIWRLAKASDYRDDESGNHGVRIANYCRILGEALQLPSDTVNLLYLTSPLHDIGKIGIPDSILMKTDKLTVEERKIMEQHSKIGADILASKPIGLEQFPSFYSAFPSFQNQNNHENPLLQVATSIAMTHHERWDGKGYPSHLEGEEIPLEGRIVALADVYDALRSPRPFKPALTHKQTLELKVKGKGSHFDPDLFNVFERENEKFSKIWDRLPDETTY
jgi:response regulator RpfG family c-di-GMP phosphodiesterase